MDLLDIKVVRLPGNEDIPMPGYATSGSAGMDLVAALREPLTLAPGQRAIIPTGLTLSIPSGFEAQIRGRSGIAINKGIGLVNAPGTIDSDYRGEIGIIVINWSDQPQRIERGDRIAQMVIAAVIRANLVECETLDPTGRGVGGFGHSGT